MSDIHLLYMWTITAIENARPAELEVAVILSCQDSCRGKAKLPVVRSGQEDLLQSHAK